MKITCILVVFALTAFASCDRKPQNTKRAEQPIVAKPIVAGTAKEAPEMTPSTNATATPTPN